MHITILINEFDTHIEHVEEQWKNFKFQTNELREL